MPEDIRFMNESKLLSANEIVDIASLFIHEYGIKKIRFTGGEPLTNPKAPEIIKQLSLLPVKMAITTNAILLDQFLELFKETGLQSVNISLDTLNPKKFKSITKRDVFYLVMENIRKAVELDFRVKLNMVAILGMNDEEILDFIRLTQHEDIHVRFIEFMPFDGNSWEWDRVIGHQYILAKVMQTLPVEKLSDEPNSTSKAYRITGWKGTFAIISTVTQPFCESCNRIRLTADGKLRNCLFDRGELDLLKPLRNGMDIKPIIEAAINNKSEKLGGLPGFDQVEELIPKLSDRSMVKIGG